jgi:hypothetical protein
MQKARVVILFSRPSAIFNTLEALAQFPRGTVEAAARGALGSERRAGAS